VTGPRNEARRPARTCVSCRTERDKRDLVRIVRTPSGDVRVDPTGKASGRGAYLCADPVCWEKARKSRAVQRALAVPSSDALGALLAAGPPMGSASGSMTVGATDGA
jgi:hypothetical protein